MPHPLDIPLPRGWTRQVRSALLHAIALAATAFAAVRSQAAASRSPQRRLQADLARANAEIALLKEELAIKDARWSRLLSRRRPHYTPIQRMRILQLRAVRGWTCQQAARRFLIDEQTLRSWMRRLDEEGERALVRASEPVNRFPDFVRYLVKQLKTLLPSMGKVRIAQVLARAGLHLGATTVGRILREPEPIAKEAFEIEREAAATIRMVTAKHPGHIWHIDLTTVPTSAGFWVPWMPFALPQSWPFCWWVAVVIDHLSRAVVGVAVFFGPPTSNEVQGLLDRAVQKEGRAPKYLVTDRGCQFWCKPFKGWCRRRAIRPRFGAVGKYGSVAVAERFIRSMKSECTRRVLVPLRLEAMQAELALFAAWYNEIRPHMALAGRTPSEVYLGTRPANTEPRFEPRPKWPPRSPCASPQASIRATCGTRLQLVVGYLEGRKHLPAVELRRAV